MTPWNLKQWIAIVQGSILNKCQSILLLIPLTGHWWVIRVSIYCSCFLITIAAGRRFGDYRSLCSETCKVRSHRECTDQAGDQTERENAFNPVKNQRFWQRLDMTALWISASHHLVEIWLSKQPNILSASLHRQNQNGKIRDALSRLVNNCTGYNLASELPNVWLQKPGKMAQSPSTHMKCS